MLLVHNAGVINIRWTAHRTACIMLYHRGLDWIDEHP
jgi:hypothetical protein